MLKANFVEQMTYAGIGASVCALCPRPFPASDAKNHKRFIKHTGKLLFFAALIRAYHLVAGSGFRNEVDKEKFMSEMGFPSLVSKQIAEMFGQYRRRGEGACFQFPKEKMDRLILHLIVVGLHTSKFKLNLSVLATELKLAIKNVTLFARELGCKITKSAGASIAVLNAPLVFPSLKRGGNKGGK